MVFYFTTADGHMLYMGKDKYENEDLIRYGLPEDVWFHVDDLSSAHVYLRMRRDEKFKELDPSLVADCCHLVKANSIEGCKKPHVDVVYTRWANLRKTNGMEVGQVGFRDESKVRKLRVEKNNAVVNALNRTKREEHPDLQALQEAREAETRRELKTQRQKQALAEKERRKKEEEDRKTRSYESLFNEARAAPQPAMKGSKDATASVAYEDDFM